MSQGTYFYTHYYFSNKTFNSKYDVQEQLDEVNEDIKRNEDHLRFLAFCTEPKKFVDDNMDPEWTIQRDLEDSFQELSELYTERTMLTMLLDRWEKCHNEQGLAIEPPNDYHDYMRGDFVLSDKRPTRESLLG